MGAPRQPTDEEKAKEQQRRLDEQAKWTNQQQWFSKFYTSDQKVLRSYWTRVDGAQSEEELKDIKDQIAQKAQASIGAVKGATYRITDGLFKATVTSKYHHRETNRNFFIELQDGVARPRPPLLESEFASHQALYMEKFNSVYGQIMDFMAVQCGYSKLVVDLPDMSPLMSQHDYLRLNALMDLAKERGLHLSFGPKVMDTLKDRPNDYARYTDQLKKNNALSSYETKKAAFYEKDYQAAAKDLSEKERKGDEYGKAIEAAIKDNKSIETLETVNKALSELDGRLSALNAHVEAIKKNTADFSEKIEGLNTVDTSGDLRPEKAKPKANGKLLHGNEAANEAVLKSAETYLSDKELAASREGLMAAMKVERDELIKRYDALAKTYEGKIKALEFKEGKDGKPLSPEQVASYQKQRDAIKEQLDKVSKALVAINDAGLNKACVEPLDNLKEQLEAKKKELSAGNAGPAGP